MLKVAGKKINIFLKWWALMVMNPMVRKLRKKPPTQGNGSHKSDVNAIEITDCFRDAIISWLMK